MEGDIVTNVVMMWTDHDGMAMVVESGVDFMGGGIMGDINANLISGLWDVS
jgi:hypothetical protein